MLNEQMKENQRQQKFWNEEIDLIEQSFAIIPFTVSGIQDYTNLGFAGRQIHPEDFETFKRIWTGNDCCNLSWYKSVQLVQDDNSKNISLKFQLGDYILGNIIYNAANNEIGKDQSFSDYTSQQIRKSFTFRVSAKRFIIDDYYQLMFYKIPDLAKETIFRLSSIDKEFIGKELMWYSLTFESVNQDFANTGQARQQNINMSAPGQGYLNPIVTTRENIDVGSLVEGVDFKTMENGQILLADKQKFRHNPVTRCVVRVLGNGIVSSVCFIGRPVKKNDGANTYNYQRFIFPRELKQPSTPTLYRTQQNMTNCYFGNFTPTMEYWKDFVTNIKDIFNGLNERKYEGFLTFDKSALQKTNPISNGQYQNTLFNDVKSVGNKTYFVPWTIPLSESNLTTYGIYGVASSYYIGGEKAIHNRMWDCFWTQKNMLSLPIDQNSTLTVGNIINGGGISAILGGKTKNPWLIGLGVAVFTIGVVASVANKISRPKPTPYYGIALAPFIDLCNRIYGPDSTTNGNKLAFNNFSSNNSPNSIFWSNETVNFSFEADLTDRFSIVDNNIVKYLTTGNIGQSKTESGGKIFPDGRIFLVSGREELEPRDNNIDGYIIDQIIINAMTKADLSIEFLNDSGEVIWSGIYQSQGKWTDSFREIWSVFNTSIFNRENIFVNQPEPYPAKLPEPPGNIIAFSNVINDNLNNYLYVYNFLGQEQKTTPGLMDSYDFISQKQSYPPSNSLTFNILDIPSSWTSTDIRTNFRELILTFNCGGALKTTSISVDSLLSNSQTINRMNFQIVKNFNELLEYKFLAGTTPTIGRPIYHWSSARKFNFNFQTNINISFIVTFNQSTNKISFKLTTPISNETTLRITDEYNTRAVSFAKVNEEFKKKNESYFFLKEAKLILK